MKRWHPMYDTFKRVADILVAGLLLVVLSPLLLVLAILVRLYLGSPVLFAQMRPGKGGELFRMLKFRTMIPAPAATGAVEAVGSDAERMTRFGRLMRSTSLDELPELFNVLVGQMSIVGPRPLLPEYLTRYNANQARRHEVRPGITGWAQVNGRNAVDWDERLAMDVWYVDHRSFALDAKILGMTAGTVLHREGVAAAGQATVGAFDPKQDDSDTEETT